jgi:hypothetical protein
VKTGIQACPCKNREPYKESGFLLEFIPVKTGAGMTRKRKSKK